MPVRRADEVPYQEIGAAEKTYIQFLIPPDEGPHFAMRRITMKPGGGMPKHTNTVEHEQYVLQGRGQVAIGDEVYEVQPGDVMFIPAGVPHWYRNIGEEDFVFLCLVPNLPDEVQVLA
ncbi:MAG: cupin domain-containing protein [Chloroflexi bacterium]|nr:cupin domain-containing protein [Chloroflexota bacterium]